MTFLLLGSTTASAAGSASIALTMSAVAGFMDWPPSTTDAPRLSNSLLVPAPAATATTPESVLSTASSRSSRSAVWTCMFVTSTSSSTPTEVASASAAPGSSVCTCTLTAPGPPTTSRESPSFKSSASRLSGSTASPSTKNDVQ